MIFKLWKIHIICNISNVIIYCCIDDSTQKNETRRRKNLFKYIGNIIEKADVYICKSVTVLVRLPNTRNESYLKTLIDASTKALKRSKHFAILRLTTKVKQLQSWTKHLGTFTLFSTICLHHNWNGIRLLSPESECTSCLTGCRTT